MLNFTLPNFYEFYYLNEFIFKISKQNPEYFKTPISFIQLSGGFPYCSWTGGYNSNYGVGAFYRDFEQCYRQASTPLRINFSNVLLEDYDFYDAMANTICEVNHNGSNLISIANIPLFETLKEKYPNYSFVFSREADLITPFTPEILNAISENDEFKLIELPERVSNDFDFLKALKQKRKYEIVVNPLCNPQCKNYDKCHINEHQKQLDYSSFSNFRNCIKVNSNYSNNKNLLSIESLKSLYVPLGITHFTFSPFLYGENHMNVLYFYVQYFIKPEYQQVVLEQYDRRN